MHCVWDSYQQYMKEMESLKPSTEDWRLYQKARELAGNTEEGTYGGIIPFMFQLMAGPGRFVPVVEYDSLFGREFYQKFATRNGERNLSSMSPFHVEGISDLPGIYMILNQQHAKFSRQKPGGVIIMCVRFQMLR